MIGFLSLLPLDKAISSGASDKLDHFIGYGILAFLSTRAFPKHPFLIFFLCSFYGIMIEFIQGYIGRFPEIMDGIANGAGSAFGIVFSILAYKLTKNKN